MDYDQYQETHTAVGVMLGTLSGIRDIQTLRKLQDNLSERLKITPVNNLNELYTIIIDSINVFKVVL
jgi:hypothetical protein